MKFVLDIVILLPYSSIITRVLLYETTAYNEILITKSQPHDPFYQNLTRRWTALVIGTFMASKLPVIKTNVQLN